MSGRTRLRSATSRRRLLGVPDVDADADDAGYRAENRFENVGRTLVDVEFQNLREI